MPRTNHSKDMTRAEIRHVVNQALVAFGIVAFAWFMFVMLHAI